MTTEEFAGHLLASLHGPKGSEIAEAVVAALSDRALETLFGTTQRQLFLVCAWATMETPRARETPTERLNRTVMQAAIMDMLREEISGDVDAAVAQMGASADGFRKAAGLE